MTRLKTHTIRLASYAITFNELWVMMFKDKYQGGWECYFTSYWSGLKLFVHQSLSLLIVCSRPIGHFCGRVIKIHFDDIILLDIAYMYLLPGCIHCEWALAYTTLQIWSSVDIRKYRRNATCITCPSVECCLTRFVSIVRAFYTHWFWLWIIEYKAIIIL